MNAFGFAIAHGPFPFTGCAFVYTRPLRLATVSSDKRVRLGSQQRFQHVDQVTFPGWVGAHDGLAEELLDGDAVDHCQADGGDHAGGVVGQEVRPQEPAVVSHHNLVGGVIHADATIGRPSQILGEALAVLYIFFLQRRLRFSHHGVLGVGEEHCRDGPIVNRCRFALSQVSQDVPGRYVALEVRYAGQLNRGRTITDGEHPRVGGAHVGIDNNAAPRPLDARSLEVEIIDIRNPSSAVYHQICSEDLPPLGMDPESVLQLLDRSDLNAAVDLDAGLP